MNSSMTEEPGVSPAGPFSAWSSPNGMRAEIRRDGKRVRQLTGETAWSDAVRLAGDQNAEWNRSN